MATFLSLVLHCGPLHWDFPWWIWVIAIIRTLAED